MTITGFVDGVPVYNELVYFDDWAKKNGYDLDAEMSADEKEEIVNEFHNWADEHHLSGLDC